MSLLAPLLAPLSGSGAAAFVGALLSDPQRPGPHVLPEPPSRPAGMGAVSRPQQTEATPEAAIARLLSGPTGWGTSAARPLERPTVAPPVAPSGGVEPPQAPSAGLAPPLGPSTLAGLAPPLDPSTLTSLAPPLDPSTLTSLAPPLDPSTLASLAPPLAPSGALAPAPPAEREPAGGSSRPELFCPGAVRDDPALGEEVNERLVAWAEEVGIFPDELDRLRASNFGRLMMLAHPATDDPDRLTMAAKCVLAEWAADDYYIDEVRLGADPKIAGSRLAKLYAVVDPVALPLKYEPQLAEYKREEAIARAFRSAMQHLAVYASVDQMARFRQQMGIMFVAFNQGADWHANNRMPPVWEYLIQRHLNSYLPPMLLVDVVAGYEIPASEYYDPRVRRAFTRAGFANVMLNDLYSAGVESDTEYNLPRVIMAEEGCSWEEAIKRTVEIHNELMHTFVAEASAVCLTSSPLTQRFFTDTWAWMGGSRDWHAETGRYHPENES